MTGTRPRPFVFVLMPFAAGFGDAYNLAIKPACESADTHAERVDEQVFHDDILQRIYNQIAKADVIVAEMTGRNANVFYETGYAHALGKPVILLTKTPEDIPFDLQHYPHIIYGDSLSTLREQLERRVRMTVEQIATHGTSVIPAIEVEVNGVRLGSGAVSVLSDAYNGWLFTFDTTVINSLGRTTKVFECQIGLVAPNVVDSVEVYHEGHLNSIRLDAEYVAYHWPQTMRILPGAWNPVRLGVRTNRSYDIGDHISGFQIRIFTDIGFTEYPFVAIVKTRS